MKVDCWLQIVPTLRKGVVTGASVQRVTQSRPVDPLPAAVLMQLSLEVPESVWAPLSAHGEVPENARIVPFTIEVDEVSA